METHQILSIKLSICNKNYGLGFNFSLYFTFGPLRSDQATVGFDPDRIRTLVSIAKDSSHRVIMGKTTSSRFLECF